MTERNAGGVKKWAEDVSLRLMDDLSFDADAWEQVFEWVLDNVRVGEAYESILRKARRWQRREVMGARVAARFAAEKEDVPPDYQGNPKTHGIDDPRGGGFSIMQNLQKDLKEEQDEELDKPEKKDRKGRVLAAAVRQAMYWCSPGRTYRLTRQEQDGGVAVCPRCRSQMEKERFTRSEKMYRCPECGFKVPTGKVTTQKVEIEVEPDGDVEVEVTRAHVATQFEKVELRDYLSPGGRYPYRMLPKHLEDMRRAGHNVMLYDVPGFHMLTGWSDEENLYEGRPWSREGKYYKSALDALKERGGKRL